MRRSATHALRYFLLLGPLAALGAACGSENPDGPGATPPSDAEVDTSGEAGSEEDTGSVDDVGDVGTDTGPEAGSGKEGEACRADGTCETSNRCDVFTNRCVHCDLGTLGCDCGVSGACSSGLTCFKLHCVDSAKVPPASPVCYTPCKANLTTATGTRICDSDGLLEGCVGDKTCTDGTCVAPGATKPICKTDLDCPYFQTCLAGGCYSNCVESSDCAPGLICQAKSCRPPCTVGGTACPSGFTCSTKDGFSGVCTILAPSPAKKGPMPTGSFEVKGGSLTLTNTVPTNKFTLVANAGGPYDQKFTVRKLWHRVYRPGKPVEDVQTQIDPKTGAYKTCSPSKPAECVMPWLELSVGASKTLADTIEATALSGCTTDCPAITVNVPKGAIDASRWEGELQIEGPGPNGTKYVKVEYATRPEGQFSGEMYYFGTFSDEGLSAYLADKTKPLPKNALLDAWYAFKGVGGRTLPGGREELEAMLTSTRTGSWKFKETKARCLTVTGKAEAVCYPYTTSAGVRTFVNDGGAVPVPSGGSELPIALNLKVDLTSPTRFVGRVESSATLHYPGNPSVALKLAVDPTAAGGCSPSVSDSCAMFLAPADGVNNVAKVAIGGRSFLKSHTSGACPANTSRFDFPWLVPGFNAWTDPGSPTRTRAECRSTTLPFDVFSSADPVDDNSNLAGGSPVPDGVTRERKLEFYDGALIDQNDFVLLFRESFGGFIDATPVYAYGYARLKRAQAPLVDADYTGTAPKTITATTSTVGGATCDPAFVAAYMNGMTNDAKVAFLLGGSSANVASTTPVTTGVHYLCGDTGFFDGGALDKGASPVKVACPAGSNVTYFRTPTLLSLADEPCQKNIDPVSKRGSCGATLKGWLDASIARTDIAYKCADGVSLYCDSETTDRRTGKAFFTNATPSVNPPLNSLQAVIDDAFRYKTKFKSSVGATPGFAPTQCTGTGYDLTPYCFDAAQVEEARKRVDCLISIYRNDRTKLTSSTSLDAFLRKSFSKFGTSYDGFERLYSELMVVLGDEALTAAYASRFDLAGASSSSFPGFNDGDKKKGFEKNGVDLAGVPGAEMVQLHRAVQYYQLALDRLYEHGPDFKAALLNGTIDSDANFISPSTVADYLERLIRAGSQKARAWSEIAKRYQQFHRPDLARRVLKRAYVSTHLEGALLDSLMLDIMNRASYPDRPSVRAAIETAQLTFRMSLLTMRENFAAISDDQTFFGYAPDYVPFPALDGSSGNAFKLLLSSANTKTAAAYERENLALTSNRTGRVEAAKFNSELVNIRTTYENQLAELCGTFTADDGIVYPAISKYAEKSAKTRLFGDPCGNVGNGAIHNARADIIAQQIGFSSLKLKYEHLKQEKTNEEDRVKAQCSKITGLADLQLTTKTGIIDLNAQSAETAANMHLASNILQTLVDVANASNCETIGCPAAIAKGVAIAAAGASSATMSYMMEKKIAARQKSIAEKELSLEVASTTLGCDLAAIDSIAKVKSIVMATDALDLEFLQATNAALTSQANLEAKQNESRRVQTLQAQAEQLTINVESAENDPNVRIYQNDAVINADFSFNDAMSAAYRLTRVYEYYTGQSYKKKEQLFLIRMVAAGTYNLQNYLIELDNAFAAYEETYGTPSLRVLKVSLMDDILKVPTLDAKGNDIGEESRKKLMRGMLLEPARYDGNGYLVLPFPTSVRSLSPLTRTHKVQRVEANLILGNAGDNIARVYLRAAGTGVMRNLSGDSDYYLFPKRTAVLNPKLNSGLVYDLEVYRNYSFRDRPLANSLWELVINQKDEIVNRDMDLQSLSDIELFFYYTDVTAL